MSRAALVLGLLSCGGVAQSILLPGLGLIMCLSWVSLWIEVAGDESVLSGFAGMSSTSQCVSLVSCPLTPFLLCHGATLPVKHRSRVGLGLRRQTDDLQVALNFALTKPIWELFCSICAACLKKLGLKRQAGVLIVLTSEVFQGREEPQPDKTPAA